MLTFEVDHYNFAIEDTPVVPALDLEEFLSKQVWKNGVLSENSTLILERGITFLTQAIEGLTIAFDNVEKKEFSPKITQLKAFLFTANAMKVSSDLRKKDLEESLHKTLGVLQEIKDHQEQAEISEDDLKMAHELFLAMSMVPLPVDFWKTKDI